MDLTPVAALMETLTLWRATEHAAAQDVEDVEAHLAAYDMRLVEAKRRFDQVKAKTDQIQNDLADMLMDMTAPVDLMIMDNAQ